MTWTANLTWADGDTPTAAQFNAISANLDAISNHGHSGAAGDGDAILTSLDYIDYDQQGALSAPATGHTRFAGNTGGSLRYRANGAAEKEVSDAAHSHAAAAALTHRDGDKGAHATARSVTQFDNPTLVGHIYNGVGSRSYTIATVDDVYDTASVGNPTCIAAAASYIFDVTAYGSNNATMNPTFQIVVEGVAVFQDTYTLPTVGTEYSGCMVHLVKDLGANVTVTLALRATDPNASYTSGGGTNNSYQGYFHGIVDGQEVLLDYA